MIKDKNKRKAIVDSFHWLNLCSTLLLSLLFCLHQPLFAQGIHPTRLYELEEQQDRFDDLLVEYGVNKDLPPGFELQALIALSHFPELKSTRIRFLVKDVDIPLSSRPHWRSMLRSAKKRTYDVIIDNELSGSREVLLLKNQPFNAQIGIIGHELSHTVYYLDRSFFSIISDAICQFNDCRINFERDNDARLINYGLGWQRYDHALFVRSRFASTPEIAATSEGGGGAYMSPNEIHSHIRMNPLYDGTEP